MVKKHINKCKMSTLNIINNVVDGGPAYKIPAHLSFGQYILDKFRELIRNGAAEALINGETGQIITYQKLLQEIANIGTGLKKLGVKRGDVVAVCSENRYEYLAATVGAVCCGAAVTPVSGQYTQDELKHVLNISKPSVVIISEKYNKKISVMKSLKYVKKIIQFDGTPSDSRVLAYSSVAVPVDEKAFESEPVEGWSDVAYILYSSGTTGFPKGVMLSHLNVLYSAASVDETNSDVDPEMFKRLQTIVPWYHAYGLMSTINYLAVKKTLIYFTDFHPKTYLNAIQEFKANVLLVVPPIVVFLAKSPLVKNYDLTSVYVVVCGAAPLSPETVREASKRLTSSLKIIQGYGMTEMPLSAMMDRLDAPHKPGSVGYALRGVKVKVVDMETRKKLGPNKNGEVCLKGPLMMKGYAGNKAATRDMVDDEGYLKTGDIGYYDEEGCFFIVDRLKELIKYKGNQVPPAEVESVLLQHDGVAECGVVGAPNEAAGELPTAFVVTKAGVTLKAQELIDFAASRLSPPKRLHGGVIFVDEIPKTASGKILRRVLKQQLVKMKKSKL